MSAFREALDAYLAKGLYCRTCKAVNDAQAAPLILPDQTGTRAKCLQCAAEGPIDRFQPPKGDIYGSAPL